LHIKEEHRKKFNHQRRVQKERKKKSGKEALCRKIVLAMAINQQETRYNVKRSFG
jgi:hypothetical protein